MADLSAMFGKKKEPSLDSVVPNTEANLDARFALAAKPSVETQASDSGVEATPAPATARKGLGFLGKPAQVASQAQAEVVASPTPAPAAQAKPKLAALSLGKAQPLAAPAVHPSESDEIGLIDLDALMNDESPAPARKPAPVPADHMPATSPTRPVPEDASPQMLKFVGLIDSVYEMQFDQELLGNVIKSIMVELQTNPAYISSDWKKSLVQPDDIRVWIANMREVMGLNKIVKAEKKAKRATSKAKKVDSNEMLDDLASLGFTMDI